VTGVQTCALPISQDTLRQIASMEWNVDEMFREVYNDGINKNDIPLIKNLYHYLVMVYADRLYSFTHSKYRIDSKKKEGKSRYFTFEYFEKRLKFFYEDWLKNHPNAVPLKLIEELREYKKWLYQLKQGILRLGVPMKSETTGKQNLLKVAGI
jgi:hypothetical protein